MITVYQLQPPPLSSTLRRIEIWPVQNEKVQDHKLNLKETCLCDANLATAERQPALLPANNSKPQVSPEASCRTPLITQAACLSTGLFSSPECGGVCVEEVGVAEDLLSLIQIRYLPQCWGMLVWEGNLNGLSTHTHTHTHTHRFIHQGS